MGTSRVLLMFNHVLSKISKNVGIMNRLMFCMSGNMLLTLYNSFVLPYLNYSIITCGGGSTAYCNRLIIIQKRAVRIISNVGHRDHAPPLFANLKLLKFNDLYHLNLGTFYV